MIITKRKYKSFDKRKLQVYDDKKFIGEVTTFNGWICVPRNYHDDCRKEAMKNLYWLLGKDCDKETWVENIEYWDHGKRIYNVPIDKIPESLFFKGEKEIALNSYDRKEN